MSEWRADFELLQAFARQGDQPAFAALTRRHLDLVYATALRKVTDGGAAEEICQNVFGALARKAWQFAPDDSLLSWLHRTTLLESKLWLRGELRRRRREQTAAELGTTMNTPEEQSAFAELLPLLDEALLSLRERDRTALLLRFYENQSLREVGTAFGITEDTARKRVESALDKLTGFFKRRGMKTATFAVVAAALEHSATTASAAVASSLVGVAMQMVPPVLTGFKALLARLAILTRPQRAALGGAFAVALLLLSLFLARSLEAGTRPTISLERTGTNVTIRFTGVLQRGEQPQGPFRPVPGARSPWVVPAGAGQEFWRAWLSAVHSIAAGYFYSVALRADGTLWTWGDNYHGQLGIGTFTTNAPYGTNTPQRVGSDTNWQAVSAGWAHTVAVRTDGSLWAWGRNQYGQLGIGTFTTNEPEGVNMPQRIGSETNWLMVAAGSWHTVALRTDGTLWAWGLNQHGELGNGTFTTNAPEGINTPQRIGTNADWQAIAPGGFHTVALRSDGTLWAWGNNYWGQLGIGAFNTNYPSGTNMPQRIGTNTDWQTIAAGEEHTLALRADGTLWAWGMNWRGQLGIGTFDTNRPYGGANTPERIGSDTNWQAVAAAAWFSVGLRTDGTLWSWGDNRYGQLGNGTFNTNVPYGVYTPQRVGTNANWRAVSAEEHNTLALRADGTLWAWGMNNKGQLGIGTFNTNNPPAMNTPQQVGTATNWGPPP